jgi:hypothetical protein
MRNSFNLFRILSISNNQKMKIRNRKKIIYLFLLFASFSKSATSQVYEPGVSYTDTTGYIEYIGGNLPIIISSPHGGYLEPDSIPDCPNCSIVRDAFTQEIGRGLSAAIYELTGCYPYVVINLLHRRKLDMNRDIEVATGNVPILQTAWENYHSYVDFSKMEIEDNYGNGLFIDLHGHGHDIQRIELGYLLSKSELQMTDEEIDNSHIFEETSINSLTSNNLQFLSHSELLRGELSFGTLMDEKGFSSVPSQADPFPQDEEPYFTGGYNTSRHGSMNGGTVDAIQLELNQSIRFDEDIREVLIDSIASVLIEYIDHHYRSGFSTTFCNNITSASEPIPPSKFIISPNPSNEIIDILGAHTNLEVVIFDILGKEVYRGIWIGESINISYLNSGNYFLAIRNEDAVWTTKIVVTK